MTRTILASAAALMLGLGVTLPAQAISLNLGGGASGNGGATASHDGGTTAGAGVGATVNAGADVNADSGVGVNADVGIGVNANGTADAGTTTSGTTSGGAGDQAASGAAPANGSGAASGGGNAQAQAQENVGIVVSLINNSRWGQNSFSGMQSVKADSTYNVDPWLNGQTRAQLKQTIKANSDSIDKLHASIENSTAFSTWLAKQNEQPNDVIAVGKTSQGTLAVFTLQGQ